MATEYAVLLGFIAVVVAIGIAAFGDTLSLFIEGLGAGVDAVLPG